MDLIGLIVSIVGTIVSLIGIGITIFQAHKAKKSAGEVKLMKESIEREYKRIELGKLLNETKTVIDQTRALTTPANPNKKIRGLDYDKIIQQLRKYIDCMKENSHYLPNDKEKLIVLEYTEIENLIPQLANEKDQQKKYKIGEYIHKSMGKILKNIKPETDI